MSLTYANVFSFRTTGIGFTVAALLGAGVGIRSVDAADFSSKTLTTCQKAAGKAAQKLLSSKIAATSGCAESLLACQLGEELDADDFATCAAAAAPKCAKLLDKVTAARAALAETVGEKCVDVTDANFASTRGLGFANAADACGALLPPASTTDEAAVVDCVDRGLLCRGDDAVEAMLPRAYEVLDRGGVLTGSPALFPCLDVRADSPATGSDANTLAACQKALQKGGQKKLKVQQKGLFSCSDALLRCQLAVDRLESTLTEASECETKALPKCDAKLGKVATAAGKRDSGVTQACGAIAVADLQAGLGFIATCPAATSVADISTCADLVSDVALETAVGIAEPRSCAVLGAADQLTGFEEVCLALCGNAVVDAGETCDDANDDDVDSCTNTCATGPTAFTVLSIPSPVDPANTPDGTLANAVDPGSTLETQFGSTVFDLNNSTYTRFFIPGAGDPDAVLILVPGFAGGSHSLKYLAENLVVRAQTEGTITLEVWAYDRRTNQLEDRSGATLAESERDPVLAFDWYFGGPSGLSLDPRLSRRAVFHAGEDVPFLANWTPSVFARDIDVLVDAAAALPGSPRVFLGGHSLGTLFAARYASTDFDTGAGVEAGYSKLAGLVLFEGGGGALPTVVPNSDSLDLIIAKADGALYHAIKNGDARCVDGTACPGGDADCVGVALPTGALTNKCVPPVDAYTGSNLSGIVLVTPQVHAAGDVAAIQGKLDPDGLALIQQDFGSGVPTDLVPGLGVLGALPPATTGAAIGFFLDDDFSPVSAFQASLGYSDNGTNALIFGILLPQPAFPPDVLRTWKNIDEVMPAAAIPNNGFPTSANDTNGQEKEVSRLGVLTTLLFSGGINFGDSYFAASGLSVTNAEGTCVASTCTSGNVGAACTSNAQCTVSLGLDSSPLSVLRGRPDIENLTQATSIDIPVIGFGGTNGLTPTNGSFKGFAESVAVCTAPSCDGFTPRVVNPLPIGTVYGDVNGGFEVHLSEGYAHIDVLSAEDDAAHNNVYDPLMAFLLRNTP